MSASDFLLYQAMQSGGSGGNRPAIRQLFPIVPPLQFSPSTDGNIVHTVLPPEQIIPPHFTDPTFLRTDFTGCQLQGNYEPKLGGSPGNWDDRAIKANGGVTMVDGPWKGLFVPFLREANSTPPTMPMTPMLVMYPRDVQIAVLTEMCWRGYDDFIYVTEGWGFAENGFVMTPAKAVAWCETLRGMGFRPVYWRGDANLQIDTMLVTLSDAQMISFYVHGKEVDSYMSAAGYEASVQNMLRYFKGRTPVGAHFTGDSARGLGYPIGQPREFFIPDWHPYDGELHLCQQIWPYADAGLQGAAMYYGRQHVNCGTGPAAPPGAKGAPNSTVNNFENSATRKLYGECSEAEGLKLAYQLLCGTRDDPRARPVHGSADGGPFHMNGWPM